MKSEPFKLIVQLIFIVLLLSSTKLFADQTDTKLNELFVTLQTSHDAAELQAAEATIWEIWFESGDSEVDVLMQEAGAAVEAGKLEYAEGLYSQVTEKLPNFSEGWNRRATVRFYRDDYDGSLLDIQRTLVLEPRHFGATWGLGMILGSRGSFSRAIAAFERLQELKPNSQEAEARIKMLKKALNDSAV